MIGTPEFRVNMAEKLAAAANTALDEGKGLADNAWKTSSDPTWSQMFFNGQSKWGESAGSMEHLLNFLKEDLSEGTAQGLRDSIAGVMQQTEKMHGNQNYDANVIATAKANIQAAIAEIKGIRTKMDEAKEAEKQAVKDALKTDVVTTTDATTTKVETTKGTKTAPAAEVEKQMQAGGSDVPDTI
jgi:hypothetical protein